MTRQYAAEPEWQETLPNDGKWEYTITSECDGSNVRYLRRLPRMVRPASDWEASDWHPTDATRA